MIDYEDEKLNRIYGRCVGKNHTIAKFRTYINKKVFFILHVFTLLIEYNL